MVAFGSGSTGTLYGITKANLKVIRDNSLTAQSNGLAIGTDAAVPLYMFTNSVERMRITSAGNVGIGTSTPSVYGTYLNLTLKGGSSGVNMDFFNSANTRQAAIILDSSLAFGLYAVAAIPMTFSTSDTERMRITSGGGVVVGSTLASPTGAENGWWVKTANNPRGYFSSTTEALAINRYGSTGTMLAFDYGGSGIGSITTNGSTITFSGNALSDNRYKDNIETISNALDAINKVDWVSFKYKDNQRDSAGVTAQQLQTVPELLKFVINGVDEDSYKAVDYNALIGYLGKAIQELTARVQYLENK